MKILRVAVPKVVVKESLIILLLVNPTSTFFVGLPFGFIWRRALALVSNDYDDDDVFCSLFSDEK